MSNPHLQNIVIGSPQLYNPSTMKLFPVKVPPNVVKWRLRVYEHRSRRPILYLKFANGTVEGRIIGKTRTNILYPTPFVIGADYRGKK